MHGNSKSIKINGYYIQCLPTSKPKEAWYKIPACTPNDLASTLAAKMKSNISVIASGFNLTAGTLWQ